MTIYNQRLEEVPAVCQNKECPNYKEFELVDIDDAQRDDKMNCWVICPGCKQKIIIE